MDKSLALIVTEQLIGEHAGDGAMKPNNPVLHGIFHILMRQEHVLYFNMREKILARVLRKIADVLDGGEE